uniref:Uncharacterized protein n=1 Tax=Sphaeramia orbicularis TaxID=375764 RepID=A0A672YGS4_9TELE
VTVDGSSKRILQKEKMKNQLMVKQDTKQRERLSRSMDVISLISDDEDDVIRACSKTPFCLYLYTGVKLGPGETITVVLIGYFDQRSGVSVVRLLDTLQKDVRFQTSEDQRLLMELLVKLQLPLSNLVVFYCDAPHPEAFVSQILALNPTVVSLCRLPGLAERACRAGLLASFSYVGDLVRDLHRHCSTTNSVNGTLKELFADSGSYNPLCPESGDVSFIIHIVQKLVAIWWDVMEYFKSLSPERSVECLRSQLMDPKVHLDFLFLSHALEPLRALQNLQGGGSCDTAVELQLTAMLVNTYAASLLRPSAAERFLRRPDLLLLYSEKDLLPSTEVNIGFQAANFLLAAPLTDVSEQQDFVNRVVAFYRAALHSLVGSIPKQLGPMVLKNIGTMLKHPTNITVRPQSVYLTV